MYTRRFSPRGDAAPPTRVGVDLYDSPVYPHTSTFRSQNLELTIRSPRIRYVEDRRYVGQSIPVFDGKDSIGGTVTVVIPLSVLSAHDLVISFEGAFFWTGPQKEEPQSLPLASPLPKRITHVFLSSRVTIPLVVPPIGSPKRHMALRSTLRKTILRRTLKRSRRDGAATSPSSSGTPAISAKKTSHSFAFQLPNISDREIPGTSSVSRLRPGGLRGRWYAEGAQVAYKVAAQLCSKSAGDEIQTNEELEAPVCIESNIESGTYPSPRAWSKFAMTSGKTLPFQCLLLLPQTASFSRSDSIPFCISFTTSPQSVPLARRIMREASVRVTLLRLLLLDSALTFPIPIPRTRHSEDGPSPAAKQRERRGSILRRVATNTSDLFGWKRKRRAKPNAFPKPDMHDALPEEAHEKPLPPLPQESVSLYEHIICSAASEGFKKCATQGSTRSSPPRWILGHHDDSGPPAPDGLFKGELHLRNEISNTIDWPGLSLTYFIEATVMFEGDVLKTRHAIAIAEPYHESEPTS